MAETKYGKYFIKEPVRAWDSPAGRDHLMHFCGNKECVAGHIPDFPGELSITCITKPHVMNPNPHAHDYDQLLCFFSSNPKNWFEFGAKIEVTLGEEGEKHIVDTASVVYIPKGLVHCPVTWLKVDKPVIFMHICFANEYTRSKGTMSGHPLHSDFKRYSPEDIAKLRSGGTPPTP